jgi:hypothetical protein
MRKDRRARKAERRKADKQKQFEETRAEIQKIQKRVQALRLRKPVLTEDDLYDENGLPK